MKKKANRRRLAQLTALILTFSLCLGLAACGGGDPVVTPTVTDPTVSSDPTQSSTPTQPATNPTQNITEPTVTAPTDPTTTPSVTPTEPVTTPTQTPVTETTAPPVYYEIRLNRTDFTLNDRDNQWVLYDGDAPVDLVTFTSDDESIAVFFKGKVVGIARGTTWVHAEYYGQKVSCIVRCNMSNLPNPTTTPTEPITQPTTQPTTPVQTGPTEPLTPSEILALAEELVKETDFIAAGYDYQKAIKMLTEFPYYGQVPALQEKVAAYREADSKLVTYTNMQNITHIFFHSLIVDTDRAFDGGSSSDGYNLYMTTVDEFNAILEEMYARGFVLVTPYQVAYENANGKMTYGNIRLPAGKKPFIMSQDDLNYYSYMINGADGTDDIPVFAAKYGDGFASKIVIGPDGYPTCEYMDAQGNILYGDYDLVPCLETFIQKHPDFAYQGARAVLGVTGYEGVFGYRTKPAYEAYMGTGAYQKEVADAKAVAQCLKDHGWIIASHSYGHPAYGNITAEAVDIDSTKWENTVQPIVGNCDIILFPHGSDIGPWWGYESTNEKFQILYEDGYRYFFNVDSAIYWSQLGNNYYRGGRRNVDGYRMYHNPDWLADLFEVKDVFDPKRPTPVPSL